MRASPSTPERTRPRLIVANDSPSPGQHYSMALGVRRVPNAAERAALTARFPEVCAELAHAAQSDQAIDRQVWLLADWYCEVFGRRAPLYLYSRLEWALRAKFDGDAEQLARIAFTDAMGDAPLSAGRQ